MARSYSCGYKMSHILLSSQAGVSCTHLTFLQTQTAGDPGEATVISVRRLGQQSLK